MNNDLYHKRNERKVSFLYPKNGNRNVLRTVTGVKVKVSPAQVGAVSLSERITDFTSPSHSQSA